MLDTTVGGIAALCGVLLFLTISTLSLRFFARFKQKATSQIDDWLVAAACIFFVGDTACVFFGISIKFLGYQQPHDIKVVIAQHATAERMFLSIDALTVLTLGLSKLSALFFYRRLFCSSGVRDIFSFVTAGFVAVVTIWIVIFVVMTFNLCGHHSINWDVQPGNSAKCKLDYPYFEAVTTSDFILDVFILILPLRKIWTLHTTRARKVAVSGVFLLALVGLGASTARMVETYQLVNLGRPTNDLDAYQNNTRNVYFMILEAGFMIVSVNLPSLWYFLAGVTPERVLRSVRSLVSLGSRGGSQSSSIKGSKAASVDKTSRNLTAAERSLDTSSLRSILIKEGTSIEVESYPMTDIDTRPTAESPSRKYRDNMEAV